MNRYPLNWFHDFLHRFFSETFYLEKRVHLNPGIHNPNVIHFFTIATAFLSSLSFFFGWMLFFFRLFIWLFINLVMRNWHSGGCQHSQDFRVQVLFKKYLHGCRSMDPWFLLPRILVFLDTLRPRDTVGSGGVAAVCSGFCARSWVSWRKLSRSPCEHWPSSFH